MPEAPLLVELSDSSIQRISEAVAQAVSAAIAESAPTSMDVQIAGIDSAPYLDLVRIIQRAYTELFPDGDEAQDR